MRRPFSRWVYDKSQFLGKDKGQTMKSALI